MTDENKVLQEVVAKIHDRGEIVMFATKRELADVLLAIREMAYANKGQLTGLAMHYLTDVQAALRTPEDNERIANEAIATLESAAATMGRKGGLAKKPTSAENGKKGGRPRKQPPTA